MLKMGVPLLKVISFTTTVLLLIIVIPSVPVNGERILKNIKSVEFSNFSIHHEYNSSTAYNARGMQPLYNITNYIIDLFISDEPIPLGYILLKNYTFRPGPSVHGREYGNLLKQYWALLLVVFICVLLIALMPLIGLCLCCCRCFGACGGRSQPFDKKHDTCKRVFLGLLLICAASALVFGVVIAFVTNSYMQHGVENATISARHTVNDTENFLRTTSMDINYLLVDNYDELQKQIENTLNGASDAVILRLDEESKAVSLTNLYNFVGALPDIQRNLSRMTQLTNELRVNASQLNDGLRGVKRELLSTLTKCGTQECINVMDDYKIGKLDTNGIDYNQLPDLTSIYENVDALIGDKSLGQSITHGVRELENMKSKLKDSVSQHIPNIKRAVESTGVSIKNASKEITTRMNSVANLIQQNSDKHLDMADEYIAQYSIYRYYAGLAISSVLLLILMFLVFGLLCGICGKRPDGYGDDCCNKGAGGRFLMLAVALIFLTFSVLLAITLVSFIVGSVAKKGVCDSLRSPRGSQIFEYVDDFIDMNPLYESFRQSASGRTRILSREPIDAPSVSDIITACHKNKTIYDVLKLDNFYQIQNIREFPKQHEIQNKLDAFIDQIKINPNIQILDEKAEDEILRLANSELNNFEAYKFTDNLTDNITQFDLKIIANKLRNVVNQIPNSKENNEIKITLRNQALHLSSYQENLVDPMKKSTRELIELSEALGNSLKFGGTSFKSAIENFLLEIRQAESYIKENGTKFVKNLAEELSNSFLLDISKYLDLVVSRTKYDIGRCGPLANGYDSMVVAGCNRIIDPFNGFWAGVAWCLLIFLPTIIICVKLSSLYQKSDPYPGPLVESEYLYDAYSERDNIPLASGPKNRKRTKKQDRRDRDRRGEYYEEASPTTAAHRDTRYTDMAPKNWDGAPPRYQNPPMAPPSAEYERPPPYYFPGASETE